MTLAADRHDGSNHDREAAARAYEARIEALEGKLRALETDAGGGPRGRRRRTPWRTGGALGAADRLGGDHPAGRAFKPGQMFSWNSYASMLGSNAMVVVLTLALMIPLTTGDFDLSVAGGDGAGVDADRGAERADGHSVWGAAVFAILAVGGMIGAVNAFFILYFGSSR
jgi:ribose transport system permease protein